MYDGRLLDNGGLLGIALGDPLSADAGAFDGTADLMLLGKSEKLALGDTEGCSDCWLDGDPLGTNVGSWDGTADGTSLGMSDGLELRDVEGYSER